jgi:hypothetical protein
VSITADSARIQTTGAYAPAIFAQSIGGGGGLVASPRLDTRRAHDAHAGLLIAAEAGAALLAVSDDFAGSGTVAPSPPTAAIPASLRAPGS